jgi:hypothetical protein
MTRRRLWIPVVLALALVHSVDVDSKRKQQRNRDPGDMLTALVP